MSDRLPYPTPSSRTATAVMKANRRNDTKPEVRVRSILHRRGLRFRKDLPIKAGTRTTRPDIVFTRQRVAVYIHGCFWHLCPVHGTLPKSNRDYWVPKLEGNVERDYANERALKDAGWTVLQAWEHEPPEAVADRVQDELVREGTSRTN